MNASVSVGARVFCIAATMTPAAFAQPAACQRPRGYTDAEVMSVASFSETPASALWCGNQYRRDDRVNESGRRVPADLRGACVSIARSNGAPVAATERVEVRGWIRSTVDAWDAEGEVHFDVEPDYGWSPQGPAAAFNTHAQFATRITPLNVGSAGQIHVEMNHWEAGRLCGVQRNPLDLLGGEHRYEVAWRHFVARGRLCASYRNRRPADWATLIPFVRGSGAEVFAPYNWECPPRASAVAGDRALQTGDYVRLVGTLWEDGNHGHGDCWTMSNSRTSQRGWLEMHPVDFIARIPERTDASGRAVTGSGITVGGACVGGNIASQAGTVDFVAAPSSPRPGPSWALRYQEILNPDFTNQRSLAATSATEASRATIENDAVHVRATVRSGALWGGRGMYWASWRVWWEPAPCNGCATGETCFEGRCCRPACDDGCGAAPPACQAPARCVNHQCCTPRCAGRCGGADDGCGGRCDGACPSDQSCQRQRCTADVACRCGDGFSPEGVPCHDRRCSNLCAHANHGGVSCGPEESPHEPPNPCGGRVCGADGQGGTCGACGGGQVCTAQGRCCARTCGDRNCGSDGCGGVCGRCPTGHVCGAGGHCRERVRCACPDGFEPEGVWAGDPACANICRHRRAGTDGVP